MIFTSDELRLIGVHGNLWIKILKSREERIISKIYGEFKNGKENHLTAIAELASARDQINELISALKQNENQKG